jgi:hypothetical protein
VINRVRSTTKQIIGIQQKFRARQSSLFVRKKAFKALVEKEFKTLIDFFKKRLTAKKEKKTSKILKALLSYD